MSAPILGLLNSIKNRTIRLVCQTSLTVSATVSGQARSDPVFCVPGSALNDWVFYLAFRKAVDDHGDNLEDHKPKDGQPGHNHWAFLMVHHAPANKVGNSVDT
uniref:Uncharacterized protein n=1 Tax=mine drainage metagenome TaxID=410659 RepID=E6QVS1_9ZZZZ